MRLLSASEYAAHFRSVIRSGLGRSLVSQTQHGVDGDAEQNGSIFCHCKSLSWSTASTQLLKELSHDSAKPTPYNIVRDEQSAVGSYGDFYPSLS